MSDVEFNPGASHIVNPAWARALRRGDVRAYSAVGDGVADDRAAFLAADDTEDAVVVPPGTYRIGSDLTISAALVMRPGAKLKPANGVTLTINGAFEAGLYQTFDTSAGGTIAFGPSAVERVLPQWFGAKGDGVTDDTAALQAAHEAAEGKVLYYPPGHYVISDTIPLYSGSTYIAAGMGHPDASRNGYGVRVHQTADAPAFASKGWLDNSTGGASGRMRMRGFFITGVQTNPSNHGVVLRDFYSILEDLRIATCGGHGIFISRYGQDGSTDYTAGNLIENYIKGCSVGNLGPGSICYYLGENDNGKITDGYLLDCKAFHDEYKPEHYLKVGSVTGWNIRGFHCYGGESNAEAAETAIYLRNGWYTTIEGIYLESFRDVGIMLAACQRAIALTDINVRGRSATGTGTNNAVIFVSKSSAVTRCEVGISTLFYDHSNDVDIDLIHSNTSTADVYATNVHVSGDYASRVTKFAGFGEGSMRRVPDAVLEQRVGELATKRAMTYRDVPIPYYLHSQRQSGNNPISVTWTLPELASFNRLQGIIQIRGIDEGTAGEPQSSEWMASITIHARDNDTQAWRVYTTDIIVPSGFSVNPAVTVDKDAGTLTLDWTWSDAGTVGSATLILTGGTGPIA